MYAGVMRSGLFVLFAFTIAGACSTTTDEGVTTAAGTGSGAGIPVGSDALAVAGVFIGSCVPDDGVNRWLGSLHRGRSFFENSDLSCFQGKTNGCAAVEECTGLVVSLDGPCEETCNNGEWNACDDQLHFFAPCERLGKVCSAEVQECVDEPVGPACDYMTFVERCDGDELVDCVSGYEQARDCSQDGQTCATHPELQSVGCTGAGAACEAPDESNTWCDGDALVSCENGAEHRIDCAAANSGWSCHKVGYAAFCGAASECDPGDSDQPTCEGDTIRFCNAGKFVTASCTSLGFERCEISFRGAVCTPSPMVP